MAVLSGINPEKRIAEVRVLGLEAVPVKLAVSGGSSTVPYQYSLGGKLIYNRYHHLKPESGLVALQVNNIYLSNFGIRNRPPGNLPSYASLHAGDTIDTTGFKRKTKTPAKGQLTIDLPKATPMSAEGMPGNIFLSPR